MKIKIYRLVLITYVLVCGTGFSVLGQVRVGMNAPSLSWYQIDNEKYQVIFPENRKQDAYRVSSLLEKIQSNDSLNLKHPDFKIPIILQSNTVIPNGFVSIGPWRSEYNLTPPQFQFAGIVPWVDMLTLHEYRHVQQVTNARRGFAGKGLRVLFGQGGWAFYNRGVMPRWFLEGDAVYAETMYSRGGRGRSPDFERSYRAMRLSGLDYSYEKASLQSFKDFVPSHYHLGYFMTTHARRKFGKDIWDKVLEDTYSKPGFYRFSKAVKNLTGEGTKELYSQTMAELEDWWMTQDASVATMDARQLSESPGQVFTNYRFPNYLDNDAVVVQKSSLDEIRNVYIIKHGSEKRLFTPGLSMGEHYSYGGGILAWSEVRFHPRWGNEDYSVIKVYNIESGKLHQISHRSKLFSPGVSPDGNRIVAIEVAETGQMNLVILTVSNGQIEESIPIPKNEVFAFPRWSDDNRTVVIAGRNLHGNFLKSYDIPTKSRKELIPPVPYTIDRIYPKGKYVYYSSSVTGIQNIFALDMTTTEQFQITSSRFGAFDPAISPDGKKLVFSEYTAMGFQTRELELSNAIWKQPIESQKKEGSNYFETLLQSEPVDITEGLPSKSFEVAPFRYFTKGLLNIHSWYPYVTTEEFGFGALSKNIMNTLVINGQFTYNTNENSWKTMVGASYGAFFPILDFNVSTGQRESTYLFSVTDTVNLYVGKWKEHAFAAGIRLPFNITHGSYPSAISLSSQYRYHIVDYLDGITDDARDGNFGSIDANFSFQRFQSKALQNINPRWGQSVRINYQKTLNSLENQGEIFTLNSSLYFPGIFRNHSLFFTGGYQQEDIVNAYRFEDLFTNARGYSSVPFERIYRVSANYALPIWYPDLALGSLAFFKRFRGNLFYDYSEGRLLSSDTQLRSYGLELVADFSLVRLVEVGAGVRMGRRIDTTDYFAEFFISSIRF